MCNDSMPQAEMLNMVYEPIIKKKDELYNALIEVGYNIKWGYYTHHMISRHHEMLTELYPIPVLSIINVCDVGIDIEHIFIEGKLARSDAKKFDFSQFDEYDFDIYSVEDCTKDYYSTSAGRLSAQSVKDTVLNCDEKEVIVSLYLPCDAQATEVEKLVKIMRKAGFYIV
ncbi:MAG: hypothetical protein GX802_06335 [Clostridiales bacterium]|nr:hypothetical protein [Clostridiales bacterium]